jgi:hypothetical protein
MNLTLGLLLSWIAPIIILGVSTLLTYLAWGNVTADKTLKVDRAAAPFIASVSILAIAIPLVSNLILNVTTREPAPWAFGLLLSGLTMAVLSLLSGAYLIYKIMLETNQDTINLSGRVWIPPAMSVQFMGMILFLLTSFIGILGTVFTSPREIPTKAQTSNGKTPSIPGNQRAQVLTDLGTPSQMGKDQLNYQIPANTAMTFHFVENRLTKITQETVSNGVTRNKKSDK